MPKNAVIEGALFVFITTEITTASGVTVLVAW
jgi:hypothetical protein